MNEIEYWIGMMDRPSISSRGGDLRFDEEIRLSARLAAAPQRPIVKNGPNARLQRKTRKAK